jgi:hypothetical protein
LANGPSQTRLQDEGHRPSTLQSWLSVLDLFFLIFSIAPWTREIARSILKEGKIYLRDVPKIDDPGARLENMVAPRGRFAVLAGRAALLLTLFCADHFDHFLYIFRVGAGRGELQVFIQSLCSSWRNHVLALCIQLPF